MASEIDEIKKLSIEDRLLLIEALWDSMDDETFTDEFEFDETLKKELDERLEHLEKGINKTYSWQQMKKRILKKM